MFIYLREEGSYPVYLMCRWARVSRSGYYRWRNQGLSETQKRREELTILITHFFHESEQTYRCVDVSTQLWLNGESTRAQSWCVSSCTGLAWWPVSPGNGSVPPSRPRIFTTARIW